MAPATLVVLFAAVGAGCGVLWERVWQAPTGVVQQGRFWPDPWDPGQQTFFAGTGWYVVIALGAAVGLGLLAALTLGRRRPVMTLITVAVGSLGAAWAMHAVGLALAPPDPQVAAASAADGTRMLGTLHLDRIAWAAFPGGAMLSLAMAFILGAEPAEQPLPNREEAGVAGVPAG